MFTGTSFVFNLFPHYSSDSAILETTEFIQNMKSRYKRAFVNWKRAAAQGFGGARLKLGDYYYYGQGNKVLFTLSYL